MRLAIRLVVPFLATAILFGAVLTVADRQHLVHLLGPLYAAGHRWRWGFAQRDGEMYLHGVPCYRYDHMERVGGLREAGR